MPTLWQSSISVECLEYDSKEDLRGLWCETLVGSSTSSSMLARAHRNWNHSNSPTVRPDCSACPALLQLSNTITANDVLDFFFNADSIWQDRCVCSID